MDNPRPEKVAVVDEVRQQFADADAAIFTEYRGLKVKELAQLRRSLRANGGEYKVYKNTLVRLATREVGLGEVETMVAGPTGIAFVRGDAAAAAKSIRDFSRTNNLLVVKGGVLGEKVLTAADTSALADLPSREQLLARLAGALAAPLQQMAGLFQALPRNLAYGLAALRDQKADGADGAEAGPAEDAGAAPQAETAEAAETAETADTAETAETTGTAETAETAPAGATETDTATE